MAKGNGKVVLLIMDGLGDRPVPAFFGKTPLEAARTPNLDALARSGATGTMLSVSGIYPASDVSHLSIFGYALDKYYTGRGVFECAGIGMKMRKGDVALRANFGTVDENNKIADRRAGRIDSVSPFVRALNGMKVRGVKFILKASVGHRAGLVMRGKGLSYRVSDADPHKAGVEVHGARALDGSKEARFTAEVLNEFLELAHRKLSAHLLNKKRVKQGLPPANYLLVRGASVAQELPSFRKRYGLKACCIAGGGLYKGIAKVLGMDILHVKGATGKTGSNLEAKIGAAKKALRNRDFVFVHFKGADLMGEDGNCEGKKEYIEKADRAIAGLLGLKGTLVVVTADHSTPCLLKDHSSDPVPVLFHGAGIEHGGTPEFSERACANGELGHISGMELMPKIMQLLGGKIRG
ncbi:MAG: 2,3-bisphosphoglycerate-independent phosphoglycerate mutase [Candidatus Diapherotrites archaeon]